MVPVTGASVALVILGYVAVTEVREPDPPAGVLSAKEGDAPVTKQVRLMAPAPSDRPSTPSPSPTSSRVQIPAEGTGRFTAAAGASPRTGDGDVVRYTVEVETPLPFDPDDVSAVVDGTLADPRGWTATGDHAFERTRGDADVRVLLATPRTTDALCAPLETHGEVSCRNGELVVINAKRWAYGIEDYGNDLAAYRQYVVNHEMGHAIGFAHADCPGQGEMAPVMHQQTYGLEGCAPNPWPYP